MLLSNTISFCKIIVSFPINFLFPYSLQASELEISSRNEKCILFILLFREREREREGERARERERETERDGERRRGGVRNKEKQIIEINSSDKRKKIVWYLVCNIGNGKWAREVSGKRTRRGQSLIGVPI